MLPKKDSSTINNAKKNQEGVDASKAAREVLGPRRACDGVSSDGEHAE